MIHSKFFSLLLLVLFLSNCGKCAILTADFLYQPTKTTQLFWNNYIGIAFRYDQIKDHINSTSFQRLLLNSNLYGEWLNNWSPLIRMPKGYNYNCSLVEKEDPECIVEFQGNTQAMTQIGEFLKNVGMQPYVTFGINNQYIDWTSSDVQGQIFKHLIDLYYKSQGTFHIEGQYQGDLAVQNQFKPANYTVQDMLDEGYLWEYALFGLYWRGPGASANSSDEWIDMLIQYHNYVWLGVYTCEMVIFQGSDEPTITKLMSSNYTLGALQRRFTTSTGSYDYFTGFTSLSNIKFTEGHGKDEVTNTMAAAIWWIDFTMETIMYNFYDIHWDGNMYAGNHQGFFGPGPEFEPQPLYYASIFLGLFGNQLPKIYIPELSGSSSNIKVWGGVSDDQFKVLIINKDMSTSMDGYVNIQFSSQQGEQMECFYIEAESLSSKVQNIKVGGHQYPSGNNGAPTGSLQKYKFKYDESLKSFPVRIKYAQACVCQTRNSQLVIPTDESTEFRMNAIVILLFLATLFSLA